ncbi:MAG: hypothetical protein QF723_00550 [Phycisphaerales bacterium]|nr:hypothetical protein [Phycisphaerales bacterium]MDP6310783.1 hypothetical protein [Phycisphaerales bacterium]MDP7087950.1 hypothetical protein [Phycisphaerales bacterium]MDP7188411.1 hypothetical protein [Phycisphaerales bacterium]MDP7518575.1 hypothetical protein [Phycisphaerales bacterium]
MPRPRPRSRKKPPSRWQPLLGWLSTTPRLLRGDAGGWCVLLAFAIGLAVAAPSLERAVSATAPRPSEVRFVDTPDWIGDSLIEHLGRIATSHITESIPEQAQLVAIHNALDNSGWFDNVRQVRRTASGDIEVAAVFLNPVAVVTDEHGDVLVDGIGQPLPDGTRMSNEDHHLRITNPGQNRPTRPRRIWQGDDVAAALRLLAVLDGRNWTNQVAAIDLADFNRSGSLVLMTTHSRIIWGSPPGEETPLETLTDRKLLRLNEGFQTTGRIDQHHRGILDLRDASHFVSR